MLIMQIEEKWSIYAGILKDGFIEEMRFEWKVTDGQKVGATELFPFPFLAQN